jgi:glycosyltransferase involved in cell wall biosynthesis
LRVAFILHLAKHDGAGKAFLELVGFLRASEVEPFVLAPAEGSLLADLRRQSVPVAIVPYRWWADRDTPAWKKALRSCWNLIMVLPVSVVVWRWKCEVVYTNTITVSVGALAAKLLRLPHIWHFHELWGGETGFEFDLGQERSLALVDKLSAACIANSETVGGRLGGAVGREKLHVVYQSVTLPEPAADEFSPIAKLDPTATACLILGSVHPIKRQEDATRAVALLKRQGVKAELWLVGEDVGSYARQLHRLAASENVEAEVRFFGFRENPAALLRAADLVLNCSPVEAFGRATVEGMLAAKPVVAARGGGNSELVQNGFNGLLYEPYEPGALAECIRQLATNPAERQRMGENARRWAEPRFTRERYAHEVLEVLASVLRSGQAGTQERAP